MYKNYYLIVVIISLVIWSVNSELILFQNSELLINIILFSLLIFLSIFLNLYNFYNLLYYYSYSNNKDYLTAITLIVSLIKRYNLFNYKNKIYMIYSLRYLILLLNKRVLDIRSKIYFLFVLNIFKYSEIRLYLFLFLYFPFFLFNINKISILSFLNSK